jgi:hypothetical protein
MIVKHVAETTESSCKMSRRVLCDQEEDSVPLFIFQPDEQMSVGALLDIRGRLFIPVFYNMHTERRILQF